MIAGLDIGNSTTELVLWDPSGSPFLGPAVVARRRTRGEKGSEQSLIAAADLLATVERRQELRVERVAICELAPVRMLTLDPVAQRNSNAEVVRLDRSNSSTPGGAGCGTGAHVPFAALEREPADEPVVVSIPSHVGFEYAAAAIEEALSRGWRIVAVLVEADEGVLIANRLGERIPVVDEVALDLVPEGQRVIVEVAPPGNGTTTLADPLALATALGLASSSLEALTPFTRALSGVRSAAVAVASDAHRTPPEPGRWALEYAGVNGRGGGGTLALPDELGATRGLVPGVARRLTGDGATFDVSDLWALHLPAVAHEVRMRPGAVRLDATLFATLSAGPADDCAARLAALTGRPVEVAGPEAVAARRGALSTPNCPEDALVCDLGGGTIDLIGEGWHRVAAGAGELLTSGIAYALELSQIAAEYVKRGPSMRMETELLALHESGERVFRERPAPTAVASWLCAEGPGRLLPFSRDLSPGEWRALRLALKEHVIGANIRRCLEAPDAARTLLLSGGGAADDEVVAAVTDGLLDAGMSVSRANVAGSCGPRYAVALGAALSVMSD